MAWTRVLGVGFILVVYQLSSPCLVVTCTQLIMQSQDTTCKTTVKVPKRQVLGAQEKKIKDTFNMLIRVLEESRRIWDVF